MGKQRKIKTMEERFWAKVNKDGPVPEGHTDYEGLGPCWLYTCQTINYPRAHILKQSAKRIAAGRYSYILHFGEISAGMVVRHKCDNGYLHCVNPDHLHLGTQKDNVHDMTRRRVFGQKKTISPSMLGAARVLYRDFDAPIDILAKAMNVQFNLLGAAIFDEKRVCDQPKFRRHNPVSEEELDQTLALLHAGKSLSHASGIVGRSWATLKKALVDHGIDYEALRRSSGGRISKAEAERAVELAEQGWTMNRISSELGFSYGTIARAIRKHGLPAYDEIRKRYQISERDVMKAVQMASQGISMNRIAAEVGYSYGAVLRELTKAGYDYKALRAAATSK